MAKQLSHRHDHTVPEIFSRLLYTLASVLAPVRCKVDLHTIGSASLASNIRHFLHQPWLDDRLRPLLSRGLESLDRSAPTAPPARPA